MNLNDRALLVQLSISQWTARKMDKKATAEVAQLHNASSNAGRYNKALLPMSDSLAKIHSMTAAIRQHFYANTLPWGLEGTQILPTANYLGYTTEFRSQKGVWESYVSDFAADYDQLRYQAKRSLGSLYSDADYPTKDQVLRKFRIDLAVFPVPSTDFRVSIASDELSRIQKDVELRCQQAQQLAMQEVWQRLYDRVKHIADKCADPKAIFRDTMIENARELCNLLPRLNLIDDPQLEAMRQDVEALLIHPEVLRNDPDRRRNTATEANKILSAMGAFMGGADNV